MTNTPAGHPLQEPSWPRPRLAITAPRTITVTSTQIQYSQLVLLNFNDLTWPHASVATMMPAGPIPVPPSVWG